MIPSIFDIPQSELFGKRVLLRADLNLPDIDAGALPPSSLRVDAIIPTVLHLVNAGAKVILATHFSDETEDTDILLPILRHIGAPISRPVESLDFIKINEAITQLSPGAIILLSNLRTHPGEVSNSTDFAKHLASLADIYVNDAFSASHRRHASIVLLPEYLPSYAGIHFIREIDKLSDWTKSKTKKGVIIGGAKFKTKIHLIRKMIDDPDVLWVIVGGALAHNFLLARGYEVGRSLTDDTVSVDDIAFHKKIILPTMFLTADDEEKSPESLEEVDQIVDVSPEWMLGQAHNLPPVEQVLWNGPMGWYEKGYIGGSEALLQFLSTLDAEIFAGGGDTAQILAAADESPRIEWLSTGGGAMIDFVIHGTLPGIQALEKE